MYGRDLSRQSHNKSTTKIDRLNVSYKETHRARKFILRWMHDSEIEAENVTACRKEIHGTLKDRELWQAYRLIKAPYVTHARNRCDCYAGQSCYSYAASRAERPGGRRPAPSLRHIR
jgi:hypothetical protein